VTSVAAALDGLPKEAPPPVAEAPRPSPSALQTPAQIATIEPASTALVASPGTRLARRRDRNRGPAVVAVLGSTSRRGLPSAQGRARVITVMGNATIDLTDQPLPAGCTAVRCVAVFGSIEILVPPGLPVELGGTGVLGSFELQGDAPPAPRGEEPWLHVTGASVFGSVEVRVKTPPDARLEQLKARGAEVVNAVIDRVTGKK
jgi:hypothetical protein